MQQPVSFVYFPETTYVSSFELQHNMRIHFLPVHVGPISLSKGNTQIKTITEALYPVSHRFPIQKSLHVISSTNVHPFHSRTLLENDPASATTINHQPSETRFQYSKRFIQRSDNNSSRPVTWVWLSEFSTGGKCVDAMM